MTEKTQMLTTQIFPDEFTRGYRGRLRVLNQYKSTHKFMVALGNEMHPGISLSESPAAATLALTAGMPLQQFVRNHSLLPFHRAISMKDCDVEHGAPSRLNLIEFFGTKVWRQSDARFCLDCIKEDFGNRGYAYWRRAHQLPGVTWCIKHGRQLANSSLGKTAFDDMPYLEMSKQYELSDQDFQAVFESPALQRYTKIINSFLNSERPVNFIHARYLIAEQAKKYKLRIGRKGRQPTMTDRVLEQIPAPWLRAQYPAIDDRMAGEFFNPIDNITLGSVTNQTYALALAALFDSAEEAIKYLYGDINGLPMVRKVQRKLGPDYWNSKAVFKLYVKHKGNHTSIGEVLGIDPSYARKELMAAGLPALGHADMCATAQAIIDFQEGMSIEEACEVNVASIAEVQKFLRVGVTRLVVAIKEIAQPKKRKNAKFVKAVGASVYQNKSVERDQGVKAKTQSRSEPDECRLTPRPIKSPAQCEIRAS